MVSRRIIVESPMGLHLRAAGVLSQRAQDFHSNVRLDNGSDCVNAKSVLSIVSMCVRTGDEVELICEGPDEEEALETLTDLIRIGLK